MLLIAPLVLYAAALQSDPVPSCSVHDRPIVTKIIDLPPTVHTALPPGIADSGERFRSTDVTRPGEEAWPVLRLICGYSTEDGYIVEREQGGRGYNIARLVFSRSRAGFAFQATQYGGLARQLMRR